MNPTVGWLRVRFCCVLCGVLGVARFCVRCGGALVGVFALVVVQSAAHPAGRRKLCLEDGGVGVAWCVQIDCGARAAGRGGVWLFSGPGSGASGVHFGVGREKEGPRC